MASGDAHASCRALTKTRSSPSSSARSMVCPLRTNTSRRHVTRASVDRSGRRLRGTARADRRSVGSGLTPDNTALRRGRAMLPGPPAQPPSVQGRTTTAPQRLVPGSPGPWAAESEPRTGWPRSLPGAVAAGGPRVAGWAGFPPRAGAPVGVFREVLRGAVGVLDRRRRRLTQVSEGPARDLGQPSPPVHPAGERRADPQREHPGIA
jgi:hypothetical protein